MWTSSLILLDFILKFREVCLSALCYCDKIPETTLKKERSVLTQCLRFQSIVCCPVAFGPVAVQYLRKETFTF
jgi:hypothetical protein